MNNNNPFLNTSTLADQKNRKRARVKVAIYSIFGGNILLMCIMLFQGCKKEQPDNGTLAGLTNAPDTNVVDTNLPVMASSNAPMTTSNVAPVVVTPPPPPEPPAPTTQEYVVLKGDSFYSIAKKFSVKIKEVEAANPGVNPTHLKVGQKLQIPAAAGASATTSTATMSEGASDAYTVKSGDSLSKIAKQFGVTVKALRGANDMTTDRIKVGQKLKIPAKTTAEPAATPAPAPAPAPAPTPAPMPSTTMPGPK